MSLKEKFIFCLTKGITRKVTSFVLSLTLSCVTNRTSIVYSIGQLKVCVYVAFSRETGWTNWCKIQY